MLLGGGTLRLSVTPSDESSDFQIGVMVARSVWIRGNRSPWDRSGSGIHEGGSGTLELSGKNTHISATEVNAGTLLVSGSLSDDGGECGVRSEL